MKCVEKCWNLAGCGKKWRNAQKFLEKFVECVGRFQNVGEWFGMLGNVVKCGAMW